MNILRIKVIWFYGQFVNSLFWMISSSNSSLFFIVNLANVLLTLFWETNILIQNSYHWRIQLCSWRWMPRWTWSKVIFSYWPSLVSKQIWIVKVNSQFSFEDLYLNKAKVFYFVITNKFLLWGDVLASDRLTINEHRTALRFIFKKIGNKYFHIQGWWELYTWSGSQY